MIKLIQIKNKQNKMTKLGLIGGTGVESTLICYKELVYRVFERTKIFPPLVIESLSVFEVVKYCEKCDLRGLTQYLARGIEALAKAGACKVSFTGITPHIVFDEVAKISPVSLVSMLESACENIVSQGFSKVALLATAPTMRGGFFAKKLESKGISVILPNENEINFIGAKIKAEIEIGIIKDDTKAEFTAISQRLVRENGVQAIVLGCTELPLVFNDLDISVPKLDVMGIHIDKLVEIAIN